MSRAVGGLRAAYLLGEPIVLTELPAGAAALRLRTAFGDTFDGVVTGSGGELLGIPVGTHAVEVLSSDGERLAEELTSIREHPGDDPIMGFATSFAAAHVPSVLSWLEALRCTVVQIYDWMERYTAPLPTRPDYTDPLGRPLERPALEQLIDGVKALGAVAQAYAPVYAADNDFGDAHAELRLYRNDGDPESLGTLLQIMDPASPTWQQHWLDGFGGAADALGFNGFHLDTYGYPRSAQDAAGSPVELEEAYAGFVRVVRAARPGDVISFNQVNGVPRGFEPPARPGFRYIEVWPPNDRWRHLEALVARSAGAGARQGDTLAVYPPVWAGERAGALRTAVLTEAIATTLGAGLLIWGDDHGALRHPYYVDHELLEAAEIETALAWHRFGLRCRDLFLGGTDTSWYELGDENGAVAVTWQGSTSPEPVGGALFARVVRREDVVMAGLLDLTGSTEGSWAAVTGPGTCTGADVSALLAEPEDWTAEVAVLGAVDDRFRPVATDVRPHREGRAVSCRVPLAAGWSVLRLKRQPDAS